MPTIKLVIAARNSKDHAELNKETIDLKQKPHTGQVEATLADGQIAVTGTHVGLKHCGGKNYLLTFE